MSNFVFVLDTNHKPLNPCKPGMARSLLKAGKAAVFRRYPFTIILKKEVKDNPQPMQLKIDPGSRTSGIALLQGTMVVFGAELQHRGQQIKDSLESRRTKRRGRRNRQTRFRRSRLRSNVVRQNMNGRGKAKNSNHVMQERQENQYQSIGVMDGYHHHFNIGLKQR